MKQFKYKVRIYGETNYATTDGNSEVSETVLGVNYIDVYTSRISAVPELESGSDDALIKIRRATFRNTYTLFCAFSLAEWETEFPTLRSILQKNYLYLKGITTPYQIHTTGNAIAVILTELKIGEEGGVKTVEMTFKKRKTDA